MKAIEELMLPEDVRFSNDHEWARPEDDLVRIGIDDYAQDQLGDIVFVELPDPGARFDTGEQFGTVESVKAVSELYMPVAGEVKAVNTALADTPELVNSDCYGQGWMLVIVPEDPAAMQSLMDRAAYLNHLKGTA